MSTEEYARECCVRSVAATCAELGFDSTEETAVAAIADAIRYFVSCFFV